jgi:NAD+ kinase
VSDGTRTVALLVHHERPEAAEVAGALHRALTEAGHRVRLPSLDAEVVGLPDTAVEEGALGDGGLDLAVAIGGDGTMLRTVALVSPSGTPVLGINVGQLGYLTDVEPADAVAAVAKVLAGDHGIETRMLVSVRVDPADGRDGSDLGPVPTVALNEAVLEKTPMGHTVRIGVHLDGDFFTTYAADGLIVATPTGSTAYSFSARGPILDPELAAMVLTPVSPHMLFDRSLVLRPDLEVRLEVLGHRPATLSVDGRNVGLLGEGDALVCTASPVTARLVTFGPRDFHQILKTKFGLTDR